GRSAPSCRRAALVGGFGEELRLLALEEELESAGRTIAVLRDGTVDEPRRARRRLLAIAPQHDHDVGILLKRARVVAHDSVRQPARGVGDGKVVHELLAISYNVDHLVPEEIV